MVRGALFMMDVGRGSFLWELESEGGEVVIILRDSFDEP